MAAQRQKELAVADLGEIVVQRFLACCTGNEGGMLSASCVIRTIVSNSLSTKTDP
jgi:hypothetical protein